MKSNSLEKREPILNNKKTLLLVTPYFPPHPGGLEKYAEAIALRLIKSFNWRIVVVTSSDEPRDVKETHNGLTIYRLKPLARISNTPFSPYWILKLRRIIISERPDIINAHAPVPGMADVAALVSGNIPFLVTYHSGTMKKGILSLDAVLGAYERFFLPLVFKKSRQVIATSEYLRLGFLKRYQSKITTISPGVDTELFTPNTQYPTHSSPNVLFVGDHSKAARYKGLDYLLDAMSEVLKKVPSVSLTVIGPSDDLDFYKNICDKLKITNQVKFLGSMGEERVAQFQKATVFALPTSNDNFPLVIAEALSCGVPVVSTKVGNIPMMVMDGQNGFLVPTKNAQALAVSLEKVLTDKELHNRLSKSARQKAVNELSWDSRVDATDELLTKLIT